MPKKRSFKQSLFDKRARLEKDRELLKRCSRRMRQVFKQLNGAINSLNDIQMDIDDSPGMNREGFRTLYIDDCSVGDTEFDPTEMDENLLENAKQTLKRLRRRFFHGLEKFEGAVEEARAGYPGRKITILTE